MFIKHIVIFIKQYWTSCSGVNRGDSMSLILPHVLGQTFGIHVCCVALYNGLKRGVGIAV